MEGQKFGTLFIDEAAQALEAACWIPIKRCTRVVLAGDHCQLPPTVKSIAAQRAGLGKTLMERIVENKPEVVTLLKVQYRMNDEIMRFSSDWFYGGQVESAPQIKYRGILDYDVPMMWVETREDDDEHYRETFVGESFGRINKDEAELTLQTLEAYYRKIGKQRILDEQIDVGIISPYRAQGAISEAADTKMRVLQALSESDNSQHGRRLPGTGARCYPHQSRAGQQRGTDRISQRPQTYECRYHAGPYEADNHRRPVDALPASVL